MKLVVDHRAVGETPAALELKRYTHHPLVDLWTTAPEGPYFFCPRGRIAETDDGHYDHVAPGKHGGGLVPNISNYLRCIPFLESHGFPATAERLDESLCLYAAAEAFRADALVSIGTLALLQEWPAARLVHVSVLSPEQALALIGLKLRAAEAVAIHSDSKASLVVDSETCYNVMARDGMPAMNQWFAFCMRPRPNRLDRVATAVGVRLRHALRARDLCQLQVQLREDPSFASLLYHLDMFLVSLSAVFDGVAHVANAVYGVHAESSRVGWRRSWLELLRKEAPRLAALASYGSVGRAVLDCLAYLRNLIHSEVLTSWVDHGPHGVHKHFEVPDRPERSGRPVRDLVWEAAERAGGAWRWGLERNQEGHLFLEPDVFIECLVDCSLRLLNELMEATEIERLAREPMSSDHVLRPRAWMFRSETHLSLGFLGGLAWVTENCPAGI